MLEVRLIDANALIKDIAESIRLADEWEKEAHEKEDQHGIKCAIDTRRSLLAMISRVKEAPTVEAEPVRRGRWKKKNGEIYCTNCKKSKWSESFELMLRGFDFCPKCGVRMDATDTNVGGKEGANNDSE